MRRLNNRLWPGQQRTTPRKGLRFLVYCWLGLVFGSTVLLSCSSPEQLTAIIEGGSMAPNLLGVHRLITCHDCGFAIKTRYPSNTLGKTVCPNCGFSHASDVEQVVVPAAVYDVDAVRGGLERGDVVAFSFPDLDNSNKQSKLGIKRVVGLPHETIELIGGEIFVDGLQIKKDWRQQRNMAILVHDSQFRPGRASENPPPRWFDSESSGRWQASDGGFALAENVNGEESRLVYRHFAGYQSTVGRFVPVPIRDDCSFDPSETRELHSISDLMLLADLHSKGAEFRIEFSIFDPRLSCSFSPQLKLLSVFAGDVELTSCHWIEPANPFELGISTFDGQISIAVDNQELIRVSHNSIPVSDGTLLVYPISISAQKSGLIFRRLRVLRDVYYFDSLIGSESDPESRPKYSLPGDEYFVVGDNVAGSIDSRHWSHSGLARKQIIGRLSNHR